MLTRAVRLGDDIDDFCVKCKRVMNHSVVSILNDGPAKVRCRTCHSDHDFRNELPPPPKVDARKAALFNQVLGNVTGLPADPPADPKPAEAKAPEAKPAPVEVKPEAKPEPKTKAPVKAKAVAKKAKKARA